MIMNSHYSIGSVGRKNKLASLSGYRKICKFGYLCINRKEGRPWNSDNDWFDNKMVSICTEPLKHTTRHNRVRGFFFFSPRNTGTNRSHLQLRLTLQVSKCISLDVIIIHYSTSLYVPMYSLLKPKTGMYSARGLNFDLPLCFFSFPWQLTVSEKF